MSAAGFDLPSLLAAHSQGGGDQPDQPGQDPLQVLQEVLNDVHRLIAVLPDPQDTQDAIQAMRVLAGVQTRLMSRQQQG